MTISIFIVRYTESRYTHLPNLPDKLLLQIRMNDAIVKRTQIGDLNDCLVQTDKTFDVQVLCDSVLAVRTVSRSGVDECADRADIIWRVEPGIAVGCGDSGFVGWDIGRQEEDDDVEAGSESVFLYPNSDAPVRS